MNKITAAFQNGKAFIPFLTGGDPDIETTEKLVRAMAQAGADIIEIGVPFSDPIAEGTVIQEASQRALDGGCTVDQLFDMVARLRQDVTIPLIFMGYGNSVYGYGAERFMGRCKEVGVDGVILPDVPFEERAEFREVLDRYGITQISMVAPTSQNRARAIARESKGFLYCVSSLGVTGVRSQLSSQIGEIIALARQESNTPCAIGFGISTPEQARDMAQLADGVIVGSAIVKLIAANGRNSVPVVSEYVKSMKDAIRDL
jgi:tryptophan synthase alpha chain